MAKFDALKQRGLKSVALATTHEAVLAPRLPPGHKAYLEDKLRQLGIAIPTQKAARERAKQLSVAQREAFGDLLALLTALRQNVKADSDSTAQDRKEYGVGLKLDPRNVEATLAASLSVLRVAREKPERAQLLGILPADLTKLEALYQAAKSADEAEDSTRANAPLTTKERNALVESVEAAVKKIGGAGVLAFAFDPKIRAEFEALLAGPGNSGGGGGGDNGGGSTGG